jgi:hypothetical protein
VPDASLRDRSLREHAGEKGSSQAEFGIVNIIPQNSSVDRPLLLDEIT